MYKFIFIYLYELLNKVNPVSAFDSARSFTIVAVFFHMFFISNIFLYFSKYNSLRSVIDLGSNKYYLIPIVLLIVFGLYRLFNKSRMDHLIEKYDSQENLVNVKSSILMLIITILPFLLGIWLLNAK